MGWNIDVEIPAYDKMVICVAPHTSNWDFIVGRLFYMSKGLKVAFLIKKEWLKPPFKSLMLKLGAVPVDRSRKSSMTDQLAERFRESDHLHLAITPEGTRKPNPDWKLGFYYIAKKAGVPIVLAAFDYKLKEILVLGTVYPGDDEQADIAAIKAKYKGINAKHPENFVL